MAAVFALVACGDDAGTTGSELPPTRIESDPAATTTAAATTTPSGTADPSTTAGPTELDSAAVVADDSTNRAGRVVEPADAVDPAERLDEPVAVSWIGGSDVTWEDRSLPPAMNELLPRVGHRPVSFRSATAIGPTPERLAELVESEVAGGADALIVAMNVSWAAWGGTTRCNGVQGAYEFYACILEPVAEPELGQRRASVQTLVDAMVDSGLPAFAYIIPHSTQALNDPLLADRITAAEAFIAGFDPGLDRIAYAETIATRGVAGADEGTAFLDMVHPSLDGVDLVAGVLAPGIESFLAASFS